MFGKIHIHPFTLPLFALVLFSGKGKAFFILYLFIFLHELSHFLAALILGAKPDKIHILPWGCMLSISAFPSKIKSLAILSAGPFFNLILCFLGFYPDENLSLALFNLMPVMPLDGGAIISLLFPRLYFYIALAFILCTFSAALYLRVGPALPVILLSLLFLGEKNRLDKTITAKIIGHFRAKS